MELFALLTLLYYILYVGSLEKECFNNCALFLWTFFHLSRLFPND